MYYFNKIIQTFKDESQKAYRISFIFLIAIVTFFSVFRAYFGLSPVNFYPWDLFTFLDGGWRISNGQIPHADFYNPIGPLTYILISIGMKIGRLSANSLVYGNIIIGVILSLWTWHITKNRISAINALIFSVFIFIFTISFRALGGEITNTTYAMIYNRYGYALYSMLIIELFILPRNYSKTLSILGGLSTGLLLGLLFFCKITFFLCATIAILIYFILFRDTFCRAKFVCVGFLLICFGIMFFYKIGITNYFKDILFSGASQSLDMRIIKFIKGLYYNWLFIYFTYLILIIAFIIKFYNGYKKDELKEYLRLLVVITLVIVSGMLLTSTNFTERADIPIFSVTGLLLLDYSGRGLRIDENTSFKNKLLFFLCISIVFPLFFGHIFKRDAGSMFYSASWNLTKLRIITNTQRFESETLYDFVIPNTADAKTSYYRVKDVPSRINDGLNLLRRHVDNNSRIFCFCLTNPFSFALELPPAKGAPLWWHDNISFTKDVYPKPETIFSDTNIVMIPIFNDADDGWEKGSVNLMLKLYGEFIRKNFMVKERSNNWTLLLKR